jgi:hypothetical protein
LFVQLIILYFCVSDSENNPSPLRNSVFEDEVTTMDQWHEIVEMCQQYNHHDYALDILAASTVIMAVRGATAYVEEMERLRLEQERRKQQEEERKQEENRNKKKKRRRRYVNKADLETGYDVVDNNDMSESVQPRESTPTLEIMTEAENIQ